jgi:RecA-family ATPase
MDTNGNLFREPFIPLVQILTEKHTDEQTWREKWKHHREFGKLVIARSLGVRKSEVESLFKGVRKGSQGIGESMRNRKHSKLLPAFESWDDLEDAELPELKIILEGIYNQGAKMTVGGDSKAGKTWLLMHLALCIATGRDWLGIKTYQGRILYVSCELQKQIFKRRGHHIRGWLTKVDLLNLASKTQ